MRKGDARSEMDRLFAEMPGAPAALVLVAATRGRLGYDGPRNDPSHQAAEATAKHTRTEGPYGGGGTSTDGVPRSTRSRS